MVKSIKKGGDLPPVTALYFLSKVGDQDAMVTASRNSQTAILSSAGTDVNDVVSMVIALSEKLSKSK